MLETTNTNENQVDLRSSKKKNHNWDSNAKCNFRCKNKGRKNWPTQKKNKIDNQKQE